jgi:hypothetical protein
VFQKITDEWTAELAHTQAKNAELERFITKQDELNQILKKQYTDA